MKDKYIVVRKFKPVEFVAIVNEMMDKGYVPVGGLVIAEDYLHQSMILEDIKHE